MDISFYPTEDVMDDVAWIPNKHYSGVYGLLKLTLPKLLPPDLDKVIVLDTDLIFLSDIAKVSAHIKNGHHDNLNYFERSSHWIF